LLAKLGQRWITTYAHTATFTLLPVITYVITKVISGNIALSLGMVGALSIVRFRNPVRSPLELSVYFAAITMGIAASVDPLWFIFFVVSILVAFGCLGVVSWVSKVLFKKQFFNASFTEGNSLSTLDLTTSDGIDILDNSKLLKSKSVDGNTTSYLLVSDNLGQLRQILSKCENSKHLIRYQLNA
jgi:hypothetical protein